MTLYLRDQNNRSIVDIELNFSDSKKDLHSSVLIENYSKLLLDNPERSDDIISDFQELSELRGWFWEVYLESEKNPSEKDCVEKVTKILEEIAKKYNLSVVND